MIYELYEVWGVDEEGHEELLETSNSKKQSLEIAESLLGMGYLQIVVYKENGNGDVVEVKTFEQG